jgi:hypothetical protein
MPQIVKVSYFSHSHFQPIEALKSEEKFDLLIEGTKFV